MYITISGSDDIDQKERFIKMGITAEFISVTCQDLDTMKSVKEGTSKLIFISPESLLNNPQWRYILLTDVYQNNLVCVAIDEAHCVPKWYVHDKTLSEYTDNYADFCFYYVGVIHSGRPIEELARLKVSYHPQFGLWPLLPQLP